MNDDDDDDSSGSSGSSSDEESVVVNESKARAATIMAGKRKSNTLYNYENKFKNVFLPFMDSNYPQTFSLPGEGIEFEPDILLKKVTPDMIIDFFGTVMIKNDKHGNPLVPKKHQSYSHVSGYNSSIKSYYDKRKVPITPELDKTIKDFLMGYKRQVATLKQNGEMKVTEGKAAISFDGYRLIANAALKQTTDFPLAIFAWLFIVLSWNIMARCNTTSSIMFDHLQWSGDCLVVAVPQHKGDQEGSKSIPKHVYANPTNPALCAILALAVYVFTIGYRREGSKRALFGQEKKAEGRFSDWLRKTFSKCAEDLLGMGIFILELGTHSIRKGIATFLSGIPGGPTAIAIYLRAGWSLGPVQSRYILEAGGSDQLCGRAATGLDINSTEFSSLPPHFDRQTTELFTPEEWEEFLPGYSTFYPMDFRGVVPFLVASLAYHKTWLEDTLPAGHPLFRCRLWVHRKFREVLVPAVLGGTFYNAQSQMRATGIPCHLIIAQSVETLESRIRSMEDALIAAKEEIPETLKNLLLDHFEINGAVQVTRADMNTMIQTMRDELLTAIRDNGGRGQAAVVVERGGAAVDDGSTVQTNGYKTWNWGGRFHPVPENFIFPKCSVKAFWDLYWQEGEPAQCIAPYRLLKPYDISSKASKGLLSKARKVVAFLLFDEYGEKVCETDISAMSVADRDIFFERSFVTLGENIFDAEGAEFDRRQVGDRKFSTFYDKVVTKHNNQKAGGPTKRKRARQNDEDDEDEDDDEG